MLTIDRMESNEIKNNWNKINLIIYIIYNKFIIINILIKKRSPRFFNLIGSNKK
jgi:hypothetical protein